MATKCTQPKARRVTILDVAERAGVSRQTVTRAMNNMPEIRPETRERVLAAAQALDYRPSRFASNMPRQKSHAVGLVIGSLRNPYYTDLAADLLDAFTPHGWQVSFSAYREPAIETVAELSGQVDAIVGYFFSGSDEALRQAARTVPIIFFERPASLDGLYSVTMDFDDAIRDYLDKLRARGASKIGMIEHMYPNGEYVKSKRRAQFEAYVPPEDRVLVGFGDDTIAGGAEAFEELITRHPDVDTVLAFNDAMAMGAVQRAHQKGMAVPEDVRIAGIDGLSMGEVVVPPLTSLSIDRPLIARKTADLLQLLFEGGPAPKDRNLVVVPRPQWRASA